VVAESGKRNMYTISAAEKGKTHMKLLCRRHQDSCYLLWWFILVRRVPDKLKEGAIPNTLFENSKSGWINSSYLLSGLCSLLRTFQHW